MTNEDLRTIWNGLVAANFWIGGLDVLCLQEMTPDDRALVQEDEELISQAMDCLLKIKRRRREKDLGISGKD